ncbi:VirD4-like conjugal transfer protein, CD1115 family [Desulfotruncus alcoholivorax]|uniref:VirD4-like conjugal transfer protein, CD1115 family n=1 Tax=Desulfotruncus alcoholivorax TaxID=265477 RepID=UPI0038994B0A
MPLNYTAIVDSLKKWANNHKKAALLLGSLPVTVPLFYFADVWALGTVSAAIFDLQTWWSGISLFSAPEQKAAAAAHVKQWSWYLSNPVQAGWAWLIKPTEALTYPEIKHIWLWLNTILASGSSIGYLVWRLKRWQKNSSTRIHGLKIVDNPAYGTSRWAGLRDIKQFCEFGPPVPREQKLSDRVKFPGGNLIGELEGKIIRVNFEKTPDNTPKTAPHMIVFGGTGSGKSFSVVIGNIISAVAEGQSIVVIDPKGELFEATGNWLKQQGYENVWVLNFMQPEHSHRWNPVIECLDDAEISEMIDTLSKNAAGGSDSYFMLKAMELMEAMIGLLKGDFPVEQQHMRSIMTLAAWPEEKLDERFREAYRSGKISPTIYERWRGVVKKNYEYAVSNLTAVLKNLTTAALAALMSRQEIDLNAIGRKKTALFLIIPTGGEGVYLKPILSIFYKFLFKRLDKLAFTNPGQKLPVPVRNIWDEMANVGIIPGLPEIISTARSKGIHIQMILQTIKQLESVYGVNDASTILGNCPTVLLIGVAPADEDLAKMFSAKLGAAAVEMERVSEDLTVPVKHMFEFKKKVRVVVERPLMTTDEILRLDPKDAIALLQWSYPLYLRKVGWTQLPQARQIQQCGKLPVEHAIPARGFEISLPEIDERERTQESEESSRKLTTGQESVPVFLAAKKYEEAPATSGSIELFKKIAEVEKDTDHGPSREQPEVEYIENIRNGFAQILWSPEEQPATENKDENVDKEKQPESTKTKDAENPGAESEDIDAQGFSVSSPLF